MTILRCFRAFDGTIQLWSENGPVTLHLATLTDFEAADLRDQIKLALAHECVESAKENP